MTKLILQVSHVTEFQPTNWWNNRVKYSLGQLGIEVELRHKLLNNVGSRLTNYDLHTLSHQYDQPEKSQASLRNDWFINLLVVYTYENKNHLGVMFDTIGERKREGSAIFIDPIRINFPSQDRIKVAAHTAIHEIGHIFNFCHSGSSSSDDSVMLPVHRAIKQSNWLQDSCFEFNQNDKFFFEEEKDYLCKPGTGEPFICNPTNLEEEIL